MRPDDLLTVGEVAARSGFAPSALRYYERMGLVQATRTSGGQRRYERSVLRRLAFVRAARNVGLSLEEVERALSRLPDGRTPTKADWARLSRDWRSGSTSRSRRSRPCATGSTRASAAAASRCAGARCRTRTTSPRRARALPSSPGCCARRARRTREADVGLGPYPTSEDVARHDGAVRQPHRRGRHEEGPRPASTPTASRSASPSCRAGRAADRAPRRGAPPRGHRAVFKTVKRAAARSGTPSSPTTAR